MRPFLYPSLLLFVAAAAACGGGGDGSPTCSTTVQVTLSATGVSPTTAAVPGGGCVEFVNSDAEPHQIMSNPHGAHTDCPDLNGGTIPAGGTRSSYMAHGPLTCGFHDHLDALDDKWHGTVSVTSAPPGGGGGGGGGGGYDTGG